MRGKVRGFLGRHRWAVLGAVAATVFILIGPLLLMVAPSVRAEDFTFADETVNEGTSLNPTNRNVEDGNYNQLVEGDQYTDTNFSGTTENVVIGTAGGGSFPSSLDTDDATRRSYTEVDTGGGGSVYYVYLMPNGDNSVNWDLVFPSTPTTHYDKVDEQGVNDGDTTYVRTSTASDVDIFNMADMSEPASGYNIDVTAFAVHKKDATQPADFQAGIRIGTTNYIGITINPTNGVWTNTSAAVRTLNPATSAEWTWSEVNALMTVITTSDATPNVYCTKVGIMITVTIPATTNYKLDVNIVYSSVTSTAQTTGYKVFCQGYRSNSENFLVYAWDYTGLSWTLKTTVQAASDTDYNFNLLSTERDSGANEVKLRVIGNAETGDTTQDIVYFDILKVSRIETGYALEVEMTASSTNEYGAQQLKIKGYTSAETFYVAVFNWTAADWDAQKVTVTALSNYLYTYDLIEEHHRSGTEQVKIRFTDATAYTADTTKDTCYLDLAVVSWVHSDPEVSLYGDSGPVNYGSTAYFWLNYTDFDNEAPTYVRVVIDSTPYDMSKNETDTSYWDGVNYSYSTSALTGGDHPYYFAVDDANSGEVTTTPDSITINLAPELSGDGVFPATGNPGTYSFYVTFTDDDGDLPDYIKAVIDSTPYDMTENNSGDTDTTDGKAYYYDKVLAGGSHTYKFIAADYLSAEVSTSQENLNVNNVPVLSGYTREPADPCYPTTLVWFNCTYTDLDGELPSSIKWREGEGAIQNVTMTQTDAGDSDVTDGKAYYCSVYLSHGAHDFDFYATDGTGHVTGGDDSITIQNRDPEITNDPGTPSSYRNTYWEFDFSVNEPDNDPVGWEMSTNASFLNVNPTTGLVYGTTSDPVAWYDVTVWANDTYGGSDSLNFQLTVINRAPVIDSAGNTTQELDTFMCYLVVYHDDDSDSVGLEFASNASWLSLSGDYVNGTATPVGWYWCKVWANDSYGGSDLEEWQVTVTDVPANDPPTFTSTPIYSVLNNTFYSYDANATDTTEPPDTLTYGLEGNGTAFLSVHSSLGYVNGTPTSCGWWYVNISCSDGTTTVWQNFSTSSLNSAPNIVGTPSTTGTIGVQYDFDADATDLNGDDLYWDTTEIPAWLGLDHGTGELTGTPVVAGDYDVKLTVEDTEGGMDWLNWTISVSDAPEPPEVDPGSSGSYSLDAKFTYYTHGLTLYVSDKSTSLEIVRYRWDFGDGFGSNLRDAHHTYSAVGWYTVSLTVYDSEGHSQTVTAFVEISMDPDDWLHKTDVGWIVTVAGASFTFPAWLLGVAGAVLIATVKYRKGKYEKVRLVAGLILILASASFYLLR